MGRLPILLFSFCAAGIPAARATPEFASSVRPFLFSNCYACHNASRKSGILNLEKYLDAASVGTDREIWETVLRKLQTGEMPPKGAPRADEAATKTVIRWIETEFDRQDRRLTPEPGRVTVRRLNRAEYNNTLRDLLAVDFKPADDFPQDDSGYGFDNIGDVLSLSPGLLDRYLKTADRVARTALFGRENLKPTVVRLLGPAYKLGTRDAAPPPSLFDYDLTGMSMTGSLHVTYKFPVDGEYEFRPTAGGRRPSGSDPLTVAFWVDGKQAYTYRIDTDAELGFNEGVTRSFRLQVGAGEHVLSVSYLRQFEGLPLSAGGPNPSKRAPGAGDRTSAVNNRAVFLEVGGPFSQKSGRSLESLRKIYTCGHTDGQHQPQCARIILSDLARRAYRRPVSRHEIDRLTGLAAMVRRKGDSFEEGICEALKAILVSPNFLFLIEAGRAASAPQPITEYELASRLSYFLWASMPDEELMRAAGRHTLRRPAVLSAQVRRMLQDSKSNGLVEEFGGQWLQFRALESVRPDPDRFPDFNEYLRHSMRRETELFFGNIVREDRGILDFLNADYTFVDERLGKFYGIPGITGPEFRKVTLADKRRGGVFTQASVLTVSSYANRTSVVLRGKWVLENLFNAAPPPPPPDTPTLDEASMGASESLRAQMEKHRSNTVCASCHARMDPLGFGLENFDAIGAWRDAEGKFPINASGTLPNGKSFTGPAELRKILDGDRDAFTLCLTEKLLTYALGRGLERYDKPTVKAIAASVSAGDYKFSRLVLEIVKSDPFQLRGGDPKK